MWKNKSRKREKNQKGLLSHVAHSPDVPYCLVFWPQATWVTERSEMAQQTCGMSEILLFLCFVFYGNFSVCLACFSNFIWNIRISDLIWQFSIKTNKSPASENLWLLCCLSLHHDNPPWKILRTVKCKAAEMKVSSKSLEHISWGKHVPRGPLRHRVIRWRLSKHCCSLGWRERETERWSESYAAYPAALPPLNLEELARFNPISATASSLTATLHKKCPLRTLMGKCALNWAGVFASDSKKHTNTQP